MTKSDPRRPMGSGAALLVAAALYLLAILALEWDFLPHFTRYVLDTRVLFSHNDDKLGELASANWMTVTTLLGNMLAYLRGGQLHTGVVNINFLPTALLVVLQVFLPAILAYNLLTLLAWVSNGVAVAWLVFRVTGRAGAGWVAGALFAFSPYLYWVHHLNSLDYGLAWPLPVVLLLLVRLQESQRWRWPLLAAGVMVLLALSNQYYALGLLALLLLWVPAAVLAGGVGSLGRPAVALRLLITGLVAVALLAPFVIYELGLLGQERLQHPEFGLARRGLLLLPLSEDARLGWGTGWMWLVVALAGAGVVLPGRPRWAWRGSLLLGAALALGGLQWLGNHQEAAVEVMRELPILWRMRRVEALFIWPVLLLAVLAGLGWAGLARLPGWNWLRWPLGALVVTLLWQTSGLVQAWWDGERARGRPVDVPASVVEFVGSIPSGAHVLLLEAGAHLHLEVAQRFYLDQWSGHHARFPRDERFLEPLRRALMRKGLVVAASGPKVRDADGPPARVDGSTALQLLRGRCAGLILAPSHRGAFLDPGFRSGLGSLGLTGEHITEEGWLIAWNESCGVVLERPSAGGRGP